LLILWMIAPLMIIGSVAAVVSFVSITLGGILALVSLPLLSLFLFIIDLFSHISPVLTLKNVPVSLVVGYYLLLCAVTLQLARRQNP
ncbi:MAG TPA: hypothetical protein VG935_00690, partial [Patescibacteria group bacterium]|nr:hypothetical protein [Patescibacteria group bacterium]